jgi:hypothetical protein
MEPMRTGRRIRHMSPGRTLIPAALAAALLAAPGIAQAKEVSAVKACGGGECNTVTVHGEDGMGLIPGGRGGGPPDHRVPFHRLTLLVGADGQVEARLHVLYAPSLRLVAMDEPGADIVWETPPPAALRIAQRATRGITPRPASRMPIERPAAATYATPDPTAAPARAADEGGGVPWVALGAGALVALAAAGLGVRAVRRPHGGLS